MADTPEIRITNLDLPGTDAPADLDIQNLFGMPLTEGKTKLVEWYETRVIRAALDASGGNVSAAARSLGIHRQSLQQKMAQLGIGR